jgi:nicotinic acid phosphoribosyltransferase
LKAEFFLDLCFVQVKVTQQNFINAVEKQMGALFSGKGQWQIEAKQEGLIGVIVAEVKGIWSWENEEMVFDYLEKEASPQFWEWLQGYQIQLDVKEYVECRSILQKQRELKKRLPRNSVKFVIPLRTELSNL